jgi:hypothetical protein
MYYSTAPTNHPRRKETCINRGESQVALLTISPGDGFKNTNEIGQEHGNDEFSPRERYGPYSSPVQELHRTRGCRELMVQLESMQDDYDSFLLRRRSLRTSSGLGGSSRHVMPLRRSSSMPKGFNGHAGSFSDLIRRSSSEFFVPTDESGRENTVRNNSDPTTMWEGYSLLGADVFGERLQDIDVWNY